LYAWLETLVLLLLNVAAWGAAVAMAGLLSVGLWKLLHAGLVFWPAGSTSATEEALREAISGFEFLLLAPLGYFLLLSLARYASRRKEGQAGHKAKAELLTVKALGAGLLVAVLAANLVGRLLDATPPNIIVVLLECLAIVVIAVYSFLLELLAERLERQ
jgi:hypothetical protein